MCISVNYSFSWSWQVFCGLCSYFMMLIKVFVSNRLPLKVDCNYTNYNTVTAKIYLIRNSFEIYACKVCMYRYKGLMR